MKTKHVLISLLVPAILAGCSNEEFMNPAMTEQGEMISAKGLALVPNFNAVDTRMGYDPANPGVSAPKYQWEVGTDALGFCRISTTNATQVTTNYEFETSKVSDDNKKPVDEWTGSGKGEFGYFETQNASIFKGDYLAYYPYNKDFNQDGEILVAINAVQKKEAGSGNEFKHLMANSFMISSPIKDIAGGEVAHSFVMKPFTSTLYFKCKVTRVNAGATYKVKRITMSEKDGKAVIPVKGSIKADLDFSNILASFTASEETKVSEMVLNVNNDADMSTTDYASEYLSILPGKYSNMQVKLIVEETVSGVVTYKYMTKDLPEFTASQGGYSNITLDLDGPVAKPMTEYLAFTDADFGTAATELAKLQLGSGSIALMNDLTVSAAEFNKLLTHDAADGVKLTVTGSHKLIIDNNTTVLDKLNGNITFDCPVEITGTGALEVKTAASTKTPTDITFNNLKVAGAVTLSTAKTKVTINGGEIAGIITSSFADAELILNDVTAKGNLSITNGTVTVNGGQLAVAEVAPTVTVATGKLNLGGTVTASTGAFTLTSGSVTVLKGANVTILGAPTWTAGTLAVRGTLTLNQSESAASGSATTVYGTLITKGNVEAGSSIYTIEEGGKIENHGTWTLTNKVTGATFDNANGTVKVAQANAVDYLPTAFTGGELIYTGYTDYTNVLTEANKSDSKATGFELTQATIGITGNDDALKNKTLYLTSTAAATTVTITNEKTWTVKNLFMTATGQTINLVAGTPKKDAKASLKVLGDLSLTNGTFVIGADTKVDNDVIVSCTNLFIKSTTGVKWADKISYTGTFNNDGGTITGKPVKK